MRRGCATIDATRGKESGMAKKKTRSTKIEDPIQRELDSIKRLLILLLIKAGTPQAEIAKAINMDAGDLSRIMPARQFKPFQK